jgi:hypothetical protein
MFFLGEGALKTTDLSVGRLGYCALLNL